MEIMTTKDRIFDCNLKRAKPTKGANNINSGSIRRFPDDCHFKTIEKNKKPAAMDPT